MPETSTNDHPSCRIGCFYKESLLEGGIPIEALNDTIELASQITGSRDGVRECVVQHMERFARKEELADHENGMVLGLLLWLAFTGEGGETARTLAKQGRTLRYVITGEQPNLDWQLMIGSADPSQLAS